ncbi:MAG: hypothetical protein D6701_10450 [Gemmatimonadetes bacterium]|nr:MAG: hypothetical protein D6701_10450 [Gemmatimonadota bacterium]
MSVPAPSARSALAGELARDDRDLNLARAALLVACEEYPQLPVDRYLLRLDQLAEEARDRLGEETAGPVVLQEVLTTVHGRHGLRGNVEAYYDPRNSFLNDVLDRGLGIPITLSIVVLEVGWRLGLPLEGVNFPGHFLVRYRGDAQRLLVDPFAGGRVRFEDEAQEILNGVYGGVVRMQPSFLRSASKREIILRLLLNLKNLYVNVEDHARALAAVERLLLVQPDQVGEIRDRGMLLARLGRGAEAAEQLRAYLEMAPGAADARRIRRFVERLEAGEEPMEEDEP